jgi:alpha-tubulin suppressor-like RCC1 family protein
VPPALSPISTTNPQGSYTQISCGYRETCGINKDGAIECWGPNPSQMTETVESSGNANNPYRQVGVGDNFICALMNDNRVTCWGVEIDAQINALNGTYTQISVGLDHVCGITEEGEIVCWTVSQWGCNNGQCIVPSVPYRQVQTRFIQSCGLKTNGHVSCWNSDFNGEPPPDLEGPYDQFDLGGRGDYYCALDYDSGITCWGGLSLRTFDIGSGELCALRDDAGIACWGNNDHGETNAPEGSYIRVVTGNSFSCALRTDSTIACWGKNEYGETEVPPGSFTQISIYGMGCALKREGSVICWGGKSIDWGEPMRVGSSASVYLPAAL